MKKVIFALALVVLTFAPISVMADGTDPMPFCRHVDKDGNKCPLPPTTSQK